MKIKNFAPSQTSTLVVLQICAVCSSIHRITIFLTVIWDEISNKLCENLAGRGQYYPFERWKWTICYKTEYKHKAVNGMEDRGWSQLCSLQRAGSVNCAQVLCGYWKMWAWVGLVAPLTVFDVVYFRGVPMIKVALEVLGESCSSSWFYSLEKASCCSFENLPIILSKPWSFHGKRLCLSSGWGFWMGVV